MFLYVSPRTRGVLSEKLVGGVRNASWNLTLFQAKICDFPYPISDLPYNQFTLGQTNVKDNVYTLLLIPIRGSSGAGAQELI